MALLTQRVLRGLFPALDPNRTPAERTRPERIILGVRPGHRPSSQPPVRIFLGSERNQFRAERVFLWSVEKHRDPSRIYEIHLLKGLTGFRGRFWLTGFTNYRFAIPYYCDFKGRAIYNDTDQVYLRDPAELFDRDMGNAGFLSISDRDTSVMLIDCKRMQTAWNRDGVFRRTRKQLEAAARAERRWGVLDGRWNARDAEYDPDESALVHFTTLHTQPWRPFPDRFVYFSNPTGGLWPDLEEEADRAGFMPVSATRPSGGWPDFALELTSRRDGPELRALLGPHAGQPAVELRKIRSLLEHIPDADLPWVLSRLFSTSRELRVRLDEPLVPRGTARRRSRHFWLQHFQRASRLHPATRWRLKRRAGLRREIFRGGPAEDGPIQVLTHYKPGHNDQAATLARTLAGRTGRELVTTPLSFSTTGFVFRRLLRMPLPLRLRTDSAVLVAAGWLPTRVARWVARQRDHVPGLVLMGRKAGPVPEQGGVVIGCRHFGLPPHPNRIETLLPLNHAARTAVHEPIDSWAAWLGTRRRVAVLAGGDSRSHRMGPSEALQLAQAAVEWAGRRDAALLVVGSRRTEPVIGLLSDSIGERGRVYAFEPQDPDNPYRIALHRSDALMITGESESMLADGILSGKPVTIWPLPRKHRLWERIGDRLADRARKPRFNARGSIRPQQGLTYLCARALERGWILPRRNLEAFHDDLARLGLAGWPGAESVPARRFEPELVPVAARVSRMLGLEPGAHGQQGADREDRHG